MPGRGEVQRLQERALVGAAVATLIDEAVAEAKAAPDPTAADVLTDVYVSY
jgi:pyruvate dehydrogenase E1 component alpha subunit